MVLFVVQKFKKIWGFLFSFENGHSLGEKVKSKVNQLGIERLRLSRINFVDKFLTIVFVKVQCTCFDTS